MYLHLGQSVAVPHREILGIFDLDNASWAYKTREFLDRAEEEGRVISACGDLHHHEERGNEQIQQHFTHVSRLSLR